MGGISPAAILYDAAGNAIKVVTDGADYLLGMAAKLRNAAGTVINPSTEDTLATRASETTAAAIKAKTDNLPADPAREGGNLSTLAGKDFATQTTLASILSGLTASLDVALSTRAAQTTAAAVQTALEAIRDTAGVKKITDQLPAGTNEVGKVAQGTKAAGGGAWPQVLYDASGNVVGVVLDGSIYRLQAEAKVAKGASDLVLLDVVDTTSGRGRLKATLYTPDGDPITFGSVPPNPSSIKNAFALNGASDNLLVDGSGTPVVFSYDADPTHDISIQELRFTLASNAITFGAGYFGATSGPLANGVLVEIIAGGETGTVAVLKQNESFVNFASPGGFTWVVSSKDLLSTSLVVGGAFKLVAGSSDKIKVTVRDDIDAAGVYFKCFVKGNLLG